MPRGDGTGPMGMGPMTGRAAGYCVGNNVPGFAGFFPGRAAWGYRGSMIPPPVPAYSQRIPYGFMQPWFFTGFGRGRGRGLGRGRGRGNRWFGW